MLLIESNQDGTFGSYVVTTPTSDYTDLHNTRFYMLSRSWIIFIVLRLDKMNPFVYCSKTRPSIGEASSASQQPNSRQNDINLQTAADFFATRCAKGKFCDGF